MLKGSCRLAAWGTVAALGAGSVPALAGQTTSTLPASVRVYTGCSLVTRPLTFDASQIVSNQIDSTATITVRCTPNTDFSIDIDKGLNANGNSANRQMRNVITGALLAYDVYRDSPRSNVWGTAALKTGVTGNSGTGAPIDIVLYGRVKSTGKIAAGDYKDTLTVTLNF